MPRTDFTSDQILYLQEHWNRTKTAAELAAEFGVAHEKCMRERIDRLRKMGYEFAFPEKLVGRIFQQQYSKDNIQTFIRLRNGDCVPVESLEGIINN